MAATSLEDADIILGCGDGVPLSDMTRGQFVARMEGDGCLVSKTRLCKLARGQPWFAPTVDMREEVVECLCEEDSVLSHWYVLLPGERGSPIQPRVTRNKIEVIRWAEVGPCVASQCELAVYVRRGRRERRMYLVADKYTASSSYLYSFLISYSPQLVSWWCSTTALVPASTTRWWSSPTPTCVGFTSTVVHKY